MSEPVSTFGSEIDSIYYVILVITGVIFVLVEGALIVFMLKYRHREGRRAEYSHGHTTLEAVWTIVPFVLVMVIAWMSMDVWLEAKIADNHAPGDALPLRVTAKQFEWNVTYPGPDEKLDTADDFVKRNQLHLPVGRAVRVDLASEDVIHSFFLPEFRVKQDAVPGMVIPVWFEATAAGEYPARLRRALRPRPLPDAGVRHRARGRGVRLLGRGGGSPAGGPDPGPGGHGGHRGRGGHGSGRGSGP